MSAPPAGGKRKADNAFGPFPCINPQCIWHAYKTEAGLLQHLRRDDACRLFYKQTITEPVTQWVTKQASLLDYAEERTQMRVPDPKVAAVPGQANEDALIFTHPDYASDASDTSVITTTYNPTDDPGVSRVYPPPVNYTNAMRVETNLAKLMDDINAPQYAFQAVLNWAVDAHRSQYQFAPRLSSIQAQIASWEKLYGLQHLRPLITRIRLEGDDHDIDIVHFEFGAMLISMFDDKELNVLENLAVNLKDLFGKYVSPDGRLGELNSGSFYANAFATMVTSADDFLAPITMAIDKTSISNNAHLSIFPAMFSTTIFNTKVRVNLLASITFVNVITND